MKKYNLFGNGIDYDIKGFKIIHIILMIVCFCTSAIQAQKDFFILEHEIDDVEFFVRVYGDTTQKEKIIFGRTFNNSELKVSYLIYFPYNLFVDDVILKVEPEQKMKQYSVEIKQDEPYFVKVEIPHLVLRPDGCFESCSGRLRDTGESFKNKITAKFCADENIAECIKFFFEPFSDCDNFTFVINY